MIKNLPAKRYDIFQSAFEKHVAHIQQQVRQTEKLQAPYNAVRDVLELADYPNDTRLDMGHATVSVHIVATKDDTRNKFDKLADMIGARLLSLGLHHDGVPAVDVGGWWHQFSYIWQCKIPGEDLRRRVRIEVDTPTDGLRDLGWTQKKDVVETTTWVAFERELPVYRHAGIASISADAAAMRRLAADIDNDFSL